MAVNQSIEHKTNPPALYKGLTVHLILLVILLVFCCICWFYFDKDFPGLFWLTISIPVIHQAYVWICWRTEILNKSVSKTIGFNMYLKVFFVLLSLRPLSLLALAITDKESLGLQYMPRIILSTIAGILALNVFYNVGRYFGFKRAAGSDHFNTDDKSISIIKSGVFKYIPNAMYTLGFLALWAIAIALWFKTGLDRCNF